MDINLDLSDVPSDVAIEAIYYLSRFLKHRLRSEFMLKKMWEGIPNEPSREAIQLALSLATHIEQRFQTRLDQLNDYETKVVMEQLESNLRKQYSGGKRIDSRRGRILLQKLRESGF